MFKHSIKVPKLYKVAAKIAKTIVEEGKGLKTQIFENARHRVGSHYALVHKALQNLQILDTLLEETKLTESPMDPWLARILITEILWGQKTLNGPSKPIQAIVALKPKLLEILAKLNKSESEAESATKPKYVRANTLKTTVEYVINYFCKNGWTFRTSENASDYHAFISTVRSLAKDQFMKDMHVKDLLIFPPNTKFYENKLYIEGKIIIQDKASCLAVQLLNPPTGATVLDMCAGPGMKTSLLSTYVGESGKIYAIEKNKKRYETMQELLNTYGVTNTYYFNQSALDFKNVDDITHILVDPSCSGSGIVDRLDFERVEGGRHFRDGCGKLASFQKKILTYALTSFLNVKRVVYSTCSVLVEENENIVLNVLRTVKDFDLVSVSNLIKPWHNFGCEEYGDLGNKCLAANFVDDLTNGFFVAVFERTKNNVINPYYLGLQGEINYSGDSVKLNKNEAHCSKTFVNQQNSQNTADGTSRKQKKRKSKETEYDCNDFKKMFL